MAFVRSSEWNVYYRNDSMKYRLQRVSWACQWLKGAGHQTYRLCRRKERGEESRERAAVYIFFHLAEAEFRPPLECGSFSDPCERGIISDHGMKIDHVELLGV